MLQLLSPSLFGAIALVFLVARHVVARTLLHPLRSVPGPWLNRLTELPAAWALIRGNQHTYYRSLHDCYGPVVRVSPNEVSFVSVEAREEIYGHRKAGLMEKSPIFLGAVGNVNGQVGVSLAVSTEHTRQRRALGHLFTNSALRQFEPLFKYQIRKWLDILATMAAEDRPIDFSSWYTYLAFDIMGDACFAEPFGCLDQGAATEWSTSVINVFVAATYTQAIRRITGVGNFFESLATRLLVPREAARWRQTHLQNSREKTISRLADPDREHRDFMYHILRSNADPEKSEKSQLSDTEVALNVALFISAGTDTTATALTGWTYFVCTHLDVYRRLVDEVRSLESDNGGDDLTWERVRHLHLLEATIYEALRLYPPSPASQQRVVPAGGATIDGYHLPAGTTVAVAPWVSTRSSLNFHLADEFHPERWLRATERGDVDGSNVAEKTAEEGHIDTEFTDDRLGASVPFGNGPRVCIGRNLAYMEMRLIAALLLHRFDMELVTEGDLKEKNQVWGLDGKLRTFRIFHSMTRPELWVRLRPRE
ncbi:hypothetical protein RB594_004542 [Gaeumannomyces avenae]